MSSIFFFTFSAGTGHVKGDGWDVKYVGHATGADAWLAVTADGFVLKPGTDLTVNGGSWTAQVVR